jgi:hypothetical protein
MRCSNAEAVDPESGEPLRNLVRTGATRAVAGRRKRLPMFFGRRVVEKFVASSLGARAGDWGRRCGRLWWKAPAREYDTVWGNVIPVQLAGAVFGAQPLQHVCIPSLNGLPTDDWPPCRNKNRVERVIRGDGGGIAVVYCLIKPLKACADLLGCLRVRHVFLLGKARQSEAYC